MIRTLLFSVAVMLTAAATAQVPNKFNYQAIARNSTGQAIPSANINLKLTIHAGSALGTVVYSETRPVVTNAFGLFSIVIGGPGATTTVGSLGIVDWSQGNMYLQVEADPLGGTSFVQMGTTELVSVPYALYAVNGKQGPKGDKGDPGDPGAIGPQGPKGDKGDPGTGSGGSQTLSLSGNQLSISGGNTVTLPVSGGGGGSGTPTGPAGGDLSGTYPNPTVAKLQTVDISTTVPSNGQVLKFNSTTNKWEPGPDNTGTGGSGGDNWGTQTVVSNIAELNGNGTAANPLRIKPGASAGQVLKWDGSNWTPGTDNTGGGGSFALPYAGTQASTTAHVFSVTNTATTGTFAGLYGASASSGTGNIQAGATGVMGELTATSGGGYSAAVRGVNRSNTGLGIGVVGYQAGSGWGVYGETPNGIGVYGNSAAGYGGYFISTGSGKALGTSGALVLTGIGEGAGKVLTSDASGNATWQTPSGGTGGGGTLTLPYTATQASATPALFTINNSSTTGNAIGIYGTSASTGGGTGPTSGATAIMGEMTATSGGGFSAAVRGVNRSTTGLGIGVIGYHAGSGYGVYGEAPGGYGVFAKSTSGYGIYTNSSSSYGIYASSSSGTGAYITSSSGLSLITGSGDVLMYNTLTAGRTSVGNGNNGVNGYSTAGIGVYGSSTASAGGGMLAEGAYIGVQGTATGTNANRQAVRGENSGSSTGYAGVFTGTVGVFGTLTKTAGSFQIDDPIDPENKFLVHSFVESPDMKNIYDGVVTTDASGNATVTMPDWFQALNIEYRYQLTCIGQFAQAIVSREISGNQFSIKTDKPNVKVSWQVTGTRNDPYARDNRLPVEKAKRPDEKGKYIYPEGYGKGRDKALDVIRNGAVVPAEKEKPLQ